MAEGSDLIFNGRSGGVNQEGGGGGATIPHPSRRCSWPHGGTGSWLAGKIVPVQNPSEDRIQLQADRHHRAETCPTNDKDCDGSTVPNGSATTPTTRWHYPGQVETTGDNVDYNCDNFPTCRTGSTRSPASVAATSSSWWTGSRGPTAIPDDLRHGAGLWLVRGKGQSHQGADRVHRPLPVDDERPMAVEHEPERELVHHPHPASSDRVGEEHRDPVHGQPQLLLPLREAVGRRAHAAASFRLVSIRCGGFLKCCKIL